MTIWDHWTVFNRSTHARRANRLSSLPRTIWQALQSRIEKIGQGEFSAGGSPHAPEGETPRNHAMTSSLGESGGASSPASPLDLTASAPPAPAAAARVAPIRFAQAAPYLIVRCLGPFRLYYNHRPVRPWSNGKVKSIFKYLIASRQQPIHRDVLMDLFWPDADPATARRNCYQAIHTLRKRLQVSVPGMAHILCQESYYSINPKLDLWVDSEAFTAAYELGQKLERGGRLGAAIQEYQAAESLYEGDFLADDLYEDWPSAQREQLKLAYLDLLERLSCHYLEHGELAACVAVCQKLLSKDNCCEVAHRHLMRCYARQGRRHLALQQYSQCVETLARELDVPPMPETTVLYRQLLDRPEQV